MWRWRWSIQGEGYVNWNRQPSPKQKTPWLPAKCQVAEVDPRAALFHREGLSAASACHLPVQNLQQHSLVKLSWNLCDTGWKDFLQSGMTDIEKTIESLKHAIPLPGDPLPASRPPRQPSPRHLHFTWNHIERLTCRIRIPFLNLGSSPSSWCNWNKASAKSSAKAKATTLSYLVA